MTQGAAIQFAGTIGDDPEFRFTPSGVPVATLSVAVNERRLNTGNGKWEDAGTTWFRVTTWNQMAEHVAESLRRGDRVMVTGTIRTTEFADRATGDKRVSWNVTADEIGISLKFTAGFARRAERGRAGDGQGEPGPTAAPGDGGQGDTAARTEPADGGPERPATATGPRHASGKRGSRATGPQPAARPA